MASSVSQLNNYTNFSLFSFDNKDLLMKGMLMKQNAIDQNRAKLQQMRDEVANFSVAKDVDKKYLEERLVQTTDIINKYSAGDLSNPNLMNQLASKFEEVVDDKVLNAIASTSTIIREDKQWEAKRGTAEYNEKNHQHAMQNRMKYLQDPNVGAQYSGGGGFIKYTDVDAIYTSKAFQDFLKNSNIEAEYIRNEDGSGYFRSTNKYKAIDARRLKQATESFLGDDGKKQLQINAWSKYGEPTSEENILRVKNDFESLVEGDIKTVENRLEGIDTFLEGDNISAETRAQYEEAKQNLERQLTSLRAKDFNSLVTNPDGSINESSFKNVYTSIYEQEFLNEKFNLLYYDPILIDTKIDEVQFKTAEFMETKRMNDLAVQRENRLAQNDLWEMQGKPLLGADGAPVLDDNGNPILMAEGASTSTSNTAGSSNGIMVKGKDAVTSKEEADDISLLNEYQKDYKSVINNIRLDQKNNWDENSTLALEKWLIGNDVAVDDVFKLSTGRTIKVTAENIVHLEKLKALTSKDNGTLRKLRNELRELQKSYNSDIDKQYREDPRKFENTNLGDFYYREINGKLVYTQGKLPGAKSTNNFNYLMQKKANGNKLTTAEERSLSLYKVKTLMDDKDLTTVEKEQAYRAYKMELDPSTANSLPKFTDFTRGMKMQKNAINPRSVGYPASSVIGNFYEVSEQEFNELNAKNKNTLYKYRGNTPETKDKIYVTDGVYNRSFNNLNINKGDYFTAYKTNKDEVLSSARQVINKTQITILPESTSGNKQQQLADKAQREALKARLNIPSDYKGTIRLERVVKDAKPTDEFNIYLEEQYKEGKVTKTRVSETSFGTIKQKDLTDLRFNIDEGKFTPFDASMGEEAESLNLKASSTLYNKSAIRNGSTNPKEIFSESAKEILREEEMRLRIELDEPTFDIFKAIEGKPYLRPNLSFQPIDGAYYLVDGNGDIVDSKRIVNYNGKYSKLEDEMLVGLKGLSDTYMIDYIVEKVRAEYR